jgi:hypothetical protein
MPLLIVAASALWLLDGLTASPVYELNPVALALMRAGMWLPAKLAVLAIVAATASLDPRLTVFVFGAMAVVGFIGTMSNVMVIRG